MGAVVGGVLTQFVPLCLATELEKPPENHLYPSNEIMEVTLPFNEPPGNGAHDWEYVALKEKAHNKRKDNFFITRLLLRAYFVFNEILFTNNYPKIYKINQTKIPHLCGIF
ncbi:MAG: hypothetical protein AAB681_02960 [Patescibacteria group bacterium]